MRDQTLNHFMLLQFKCITTNIWVPWEYETTTTKWVISEIKKIVSVDQTMEKKKIIILILKSGSQNTDTKNKHTWMR